VNCYRRLGHFFVKTAIIYLGISQPTFAAPTQVISIQVKPKDNGVEITLITQIGNRPNVKTSRNGDFWLATIQNTQLHLPPGNRSFHQKNPSHDIASVSALTLSANSIQLQVIGKSNQPIGLLTSRTPNQLVFGVAVDPADGNRRGLPLSDNSVIASFPVHSKSSKSGILIAQTASSPTKSPPLPQPLVPNPEIKIDENGAPPLLPRAVPPAVGDISASQIDASPAFIDIGSNERITHLVLRSAPVREILSLLARTAGINIIYTDTLENPLTTQAPQTELPKTELSNQKGFQESKISLDIENESIQDVFNSILRVSGLEANRVGRTVFIGSKLPKSARELVIRQLRLNQIPVISALNFLVGMGAESAVSRDRPTVSVSAKSLSSSGEAASTSPTNLDTTNAKADAKIEPLRVQLQDSVPILRGIEVLGDERSNSITLIGGSKQVAVAVAQLARLDVRRRQVAINVRVIDVNLANTSQFGTSFSFGVGNSRFVNQGGIAVLNFGSSAPASTSLSTSSGSAIGSQAVGASSGSAFDFGKNFLLQVQASVVNGSAKILTDPTVVVQEGQMGTVSLTSDVITNVIIQTTASTGSTQTTTTFEKGKSGLILPIKVDRIDDNGFIELSVAPSISQPASTQTVQDSSGNSNSITLLSERRLESGQILIRDGQTLILSGIIQDSDKVSVTKVPILGDIPLLGALFRSTDKQHQRQEVIVLLTPQVVDNSEHSTFGYNYSPGSEARQMLSPGGGQTTDQK
jgi:type IV pilus assembly protein PilQ